jgi:amino acid permease
MAKREDYFSMINYAYSIAFVLYVSMSIAGYVMFGNGVLQEITLNLKPGLVSHAAVMMTIINPITKYALTLNPSMFNLLSNPLFISILVAVNVESTILICQNRYADECSTFNKILIRTAMTGMTLLTALYVSLLSRSF